VGRFRKIDRDPHRFTGINDFERLGAKPADRGNAVTRDAGLIVDDRDLAARKTIESADFPTLGRPTVLRYIGGVVLSQL
jgi:hypothetical protein